MSATLGACEERRDDHICYNILCKGMLFQDGEDGMGRHGRPWGRHSWRLRGKLLPNSVFCDVPCGPDNSSDYGDGYCIFPSVCCICGKCFIQGASCRIIFVVSTKCFWKSSCQTWRGLVVLVSFRCSALHIYNLKSILYTM